MPQFHVFVNGVTDPFGPVDAESPDAAINAAREAGFKPQKDIRNFRAVPYDPKRKKNPSAPIPEIPSQRPRAQAKPAQPPAKE